MHFKSVIVLLPSDSFDKSFANLFMQIFTSGHNLQCHCVPGNRLSRARGVNHQIYGRKRSSKTGKKGTAKSLQKTDIGWISGWCTVRPAFGMVSVFKVRLIAKCDGWIAFYNCVLKAPSPHSSLVCASPSSCKLSLCPTRSSISPKHEGDPIVDPLHL